MSLALVCEAVEPDDLPNEVPDLDLAEQVLAPRRPKFARARGICRWCKGPKSERRSTAEYCSTDCRVSHHNHQKMQGAAIIAIAKRWRRHKAKGDFTLFTRMLDTMIADDKAAGLDHHPDPPTEFYAQRIKAMKR